MASIDSRIANKLAEARRELLDLTARNRLIHTPRKGTRTSQLEIVSELSDEVFRRLVSDSKSMTFLGVPSRENVENAPAEDDGQDQVFPAEMTLEKTQQDEHLQTNLSTESLQAKLLKVFYDARTFEEEQGVNILYLALGFLKWYEADSSDEPRYAPLLLVPVDLTRTSVRARFRLSWAGDDITTNLSLQEKLRLEFAAKLPSVPDTEDLSPQEYFKAVRTAVSAHKRWEVLENDIVLGFFSFAKFLMYRDLHPENWPSERSIDSHGLIPPLLCDGFRSEPSLFGKDDRIDPALPPDKMVHVVDADSSQAMAIEEVRRGRNLVVQGPPGTGKSQTITNLIASAVKDGKRVLFVAEKMAALEVVKRRLDDIGLGPICLELHSHKSNKRAVIEELARTLKLGQPHVDDVRRQASDLLQCRDALNRHADLLHKLIHPAALSPYQLIGQLVRLRSAGVPPTSFRLPDAATWGDEGFRERRAALVDLADHLARLGHPDQHPWRNVRAEAVLVTDRDRVLSALPNIMLRLQRLSAGTEELGKRLALTQTSSALDASKAALFAQRLIAAPPLDRKSLADPVWGERREEIDALVSHGKTLSDCTNRLQGVVAEVSWSTGVAQARRDLAAYGRSWFRILFRPYRAAVAALRGILASDRPKSHQERLEILDTLLAGQLAGKKVEDGNELGQRAFGSYWRGAQSDWSALEKVCQWETESRTAGLPANFRAVLANLADRSSVAAAIKQIGADLKPVIQELGGVFSLLQFDAKAVFATSDIKLLPLRALRDHLQLWLDSPEALPTWTAYYNRWRRLAALGLASVAEQIQSGLLDPGNLKDQFEMSYYEEVYRLAYQQFPQLADFDGMSHEKLIERFKLLDLERQYLARQEVVHGHYEGIPAASSDVGEVGIVRREINKRRRHLPLRQLLREAGHAIQKIKPVFMMSPISVAQFLEAGAVDFDLLVIDEASQVRPVDALGAVARAQQIVVVGDDKQLPPTRFFSKVLSDEGEDEEDSTELRAGDIESILGLCAAQGLSSRMLNWHYRSRHHSLIAVSNHEFYEDGLFVIPSPHSTTAEFGLRFRYLPQGVFDRGKSATNRVEAAAVAEAVLEFARKDPKKSVGVGCFSVAQRDAILDELELRRRKNADTEAFFSRGGIDPFFVKNLENVQGDERDVIFISIGYAKDQSGFLAMQFGPLSNDGGERRLNVLITRARERCEVFASITADDIDLRRTNARGAKALKSFLRFAQTGKLDVPIRSGRDHNSEFERQVAHAVRGLGYEVEAEIDESGFFIDVAIVDPNKPGRYLLGIECDGAAYHSARWARDRDRLRQQVLEDRGWIIHRVWSTDWFHKPQEQLRKVADAIEKTKIVWAQRDSDQRTGPPEDDETQEEPPTILRYDQDESDFHDAVPIATAAYAEASFSVEFSQAIHEITSVQLARVVKRIVEIEGPVHQDEITKRAASLWGLQRAGSRIRDTVEAALCEAKEQGWVVQDDLFFLPSGERDVKIRNREMVSSSGLRSPAMLPPTEIRRAVMAVVEAHVGVSADDISVQVGRLFSFKATSAQLRQVIVTQLEQLVAGQRLEPRNDRFYLPIIQPGAQLGRR